jgi:hypothetical protein
MGKKKKKVQSTIVVDWLFLLLATPPFVAFYCLIPLVVGTC